MRRRIARPSTQSVTPDDSDISDELDRLGQHLASIASTKPGVGGAEFGFDLATYWQAFVTLILSYIHLLVRLLRQGEYLLEQSGMGIARWILGGGRADGESVPLAVRGDEKRVRRYRRKRESAGPGKLGRRVPNAS